MKNINKLETWGYGLLAGCISAASTTGSGLLVSYATGGKIDWRVFGTAIGFSALTSAFLYLKQSPLPPLSDDVPTISLPPKPTAPTTTP